MTELASRLTQPGPKRVLSLDGGGIRGLITLEFLERIERALAAQNGHETRLRDYFDLIGGTSTGAIIAGGLALGMSASEIKALYLELGSTVFSKSLWRRGLLISKFSSVPLERQLDGIFGDVTLGSDKLTTGLAIVTKRLDTGSTWIVHNNPDSRYFSMGSNEATIPNKNFQLASIIRASTAAPYYFGPEEISLAPEVSGIFVDGGVSLHNNPAFALFMLVSFRGYGYRWKAGEEDLLIVSVGTGRLSFKRSIEDLKRSWAAKLAVNALGSLMYDSAEHVELLMQALGRTTNPRVLDRMVGTAECDMHTNGQGMFTYRRFNAELNADWLAEHYSIELTEKQMKELVKMDNPKSIPTLSKIGAIVAERTVKTQDFPIGFSRSSTKA